LDLTRAAVTEDILGELVVTRTLVRGDDDDPIWLFPNLNIETFPKSLGFNP